MDKKKLATRISSIIQEKGIRKSWIAETIGLTRQQFCDMLHGRRQIKPEHLKAISKALGVSVDNLLEDETAPGSERRERMSVTYVVGRSEVMTTNDEVIALVQ